MIELEDPKFIKFCKKKKLIKKRWLKLREYPL
jgi:hypothetical protein